MEITGEILALMENISNLAEENRKIEKKMKITLRINVHVCFIHWWKYYPRERLPDETFNFIFRLNIILNLNFKVHLTDG